MLRIGFISSIAALLGSLIGLAMLSRGIEDPRTGITILLLVAEGGLAGTAFRCRRRELLAGLGLGALLLGLSVNLRLTTIEELALFAFVGGCAWPVLNTGMMPWRDMRFGELGSFACMLSAASAPLRMALRPEGASFGSVVGAMFVLLVFATVFEVASFGRGVRKPVRQSL